jgi:hypothetical protein
MHEFEYKTYYWNNIYILEQSFFNGATDLLDANGNVVGLLFLNLLGSNTESVPPTICFTETFTFILNNGSLGFSFGLDENTLQTNFTSMAGVVANKSGVYTNTGHTIYYFEKVSPNKWKITFRFEK